MRIVPTALAAAPPLALSRRSLLLGTTAAVPLALAGCGAGFNVDKAVADLLSYGRALFNGAKSIWAQLQNSPLLSFVSADTKSFISTTGQTISAVLDELAAAQSVAQAQPIVAKLGGYVRAVLSAFASIPGLPIAITGLLAAAQIVLPVLESLVGIGIATVAQVQAAREAKAALLAAPAS